MKSSTTEKSLTISEEERQLLSSWLEQKLQNKLVEEHRTDSLDFRKLVLHEREIIEGLIQKLARA
jgi:hypothetical protein